MKTVRYEYDLTIDGATVATEYVREDARLYKASLKYRYPDKDVQIVQKKFELVTEKVVR